jgi:hypothetical protein
MNYIIIIIILNNQNNLVQAFEKSLTSHWVKAPLKGHMSIQVIYIYVLKEYKIWFMKHSSLSSTFSMKWIFIDYIYFIE